MRVTLTVGPVDTSDGRVFLWLLAWVIRLHAEAPGPIRIKVDALAPEEPPE